MTTSANSGAKVCLDNLSRMRHRRATWRSSLRWTKRENTAQHNQMGSRPRAPQLSAIELMRKQLWSDPRWDRALSYQRKLRTVFYRELDTYLVPTVKRPGLLRAVDL